MNATRIFTIVIIKTIGGHRAYAPGFPHIVGDGIGREAAYKNSSKRWPSTLGGAFLMADQSRSTEPLPSRPFD